MKCYDVVIQDTLEELIAVTNIATTLGYEPIGGIQIIEDKFIQTIYNKKTTMSNFIKAISLLLADRQEFRLTAKKIKEDLVLTITPDAKGTGKVTHVTIPAEDLNDEIDSKVLGALNAPVATEKAEFQASTTEGSGEEEDDDEDRPAKSSGKKPAPTSKKPAPKPAAKKSGKSTEQKKPVPASKTAASTKSSVKVPNKAAAVKKTKPSVPALNNVADGDIEGPLPKKEIDPADELNVQIDEGGLNLTESDTKSPESVTEVQKIETKPEDRKKMFDDFMTEGKTLFEDRKYKDAQVAYQSAVDLFPDNDKAQKALAMTVKWVKAIEGMPKPATT